MRFALSFVPCLLFGLAIAGCSTAPVPPAADAAVGIVTILFQLDDGSVNTIEVMGVAEGTTLESVMASVDQVPIEMSGSGTTAFVQSIGGITTDASQGWTFIVDGEFANQGIGQTVLHPPTTVQWSFGEFEM